MLVVQEMEISGIEHRVRPTQSNLACAASRRRSDRSGGQSGPRLIAFQTDSTSFRRREISRRAPGETPKRTITRRRRRRRATLSERCNELADYRSTRPGRTDPSVRFPALSPSRLEPSRPPGRASHRGRRAVNPPAAGR